MTTIKEPQGVVYGLVAIIKQLTTNVSHISQAVGELG